MVVSVIYGSTRTDRQGVNGARFLVKQLESIGHKVHFIDAMAYNLPFLDKMHKEFPEGSAPPAMQEISGKLSASDGFVIVSGEWNHSIPPGLKNLLDHFQSEYFFKPSAIATYSAGPFGGVRASVHLRAITGELGMPSIPIMFPMSAVGKSFTPEGVATDEAYIRRAARFLDEFDWYMRAFKEERAKGKLY